ncbi:MAG: T9SS type A sorting domain-containing protein [Prevotellaceae bacterium]|jgi:hypothetical protein|nr:T9SS type A sorting domain-containing protein [Prevotellaceae bacterium]
MKQVILSISLLIFSTSIFATTFTVNNENDLRDAITTALNQDTINIESNITLSQDLPEITKKIRITAQTDAVDNPVITIDGSEITPDSSERKILNFTATAFGSYVENLIITGAQARNTSGNASAFGIYSESDITLVNVETNNHSASCTDGESLCAGIYLKGGTAILSKVTANNNFGESSGDAIIIFPESQDPDDDDSSIDFHSSISAGIYLDNTVATMNQIITNNNHSHFEGDGLAYAYGIYANEISAAVSNQIAADNNYADCSEASSAYGYGIYFINSTVNLTQASANNNHSPNEAAGIYIEESMAVLNRLIVVANQGYGINLNNAKALVSNSTIAKNTSDGVYIIGNVVVDNCTISENEQNGISTTSNEEIEDGSVFVYNSIVYGNGVQDLSGQTPLFEIYNSLYGTDNGNLTIDNSCSNTNPDLESYKKDNTLWINDVDANADLTYYQISNPDISIIANESNMTVEKLKVNNNSFFTGIINDNYVSDLLRYDQLADERFIAIGGDYTPGSIRSKPIQTLKALKDTIVTYGDTDVLLPAKTNVGIDVSYRLVEANDSVSVVQESGDWKVKIHSACIIPINIEATASGYENYREFNANLTITINKAILNITANAETKTYGQVDPELTYVAEGFVNNENDSVITGQLSRAEGENVNSYIINQGTLSAKNYNIVFANADFTINKAILNVSVDEEQEKIYGQLDPVFTYTATGLTERDDNSVITGQLSRPQGENIGTYPINQGTLTAGSNYDIVFTADTFTINKATLKIIVDEGQEKIYGQPDPVEFTYTVNGLTGGDDNSIIQGHLAREEGENLGKYPINQGTLSASNNYIIQFIETDFTIAQTKLYVAIDEGQSKIYGQTDPVFTYTITGLIGGDGINVLSGQPIREEGENIGTYIIEQGSLTASNYDIIFTSAAFTINKAILNITANAGQSKLYGETDPELTYTAIRFVGGDDASGISGKLIRDEGEKTGSYMIRQGSLLASDNYTISFTNSEFNIIGTLAELDSLKINDIPVDLTTGTTLTYVLDCNTIGEINLMATAQQSGNPTINGNLFSHKFTPVIGTNQLEIIVESQNGNQTKNYTLNIIRPVPDVIVQVWNDVLSVINVPANNGGYLFKAYQWQENGKDIIGETGGNLFLNGNPNALTSIYTVRLTTNGGRELQSCPVKLAVIPEVSSNKIYPNPVINNQAIFESEDLLIGDNVEIFNENGVLVTKTTAASNHKVELNLSGLTKGFYVIKSNNKCVKIIKE